MRHRRNERKNPDPDHDCIHDLTDEEVRQLREYNREFYAMKRTHKILLGVFAVIVALNGLTLAAVQHYSSEVQALAVQSATAQTDREWTKQAIKRIENEVTSNDSRRHN